MGRKRLAIIDTDDTGTGSVNVSAGGGTVVAQDEGDEDTPDGDTDTAAGTADDVWPIGGTIERVLAVEGVETGDGRLWEPGAFTWASGDLPFMALDTTTMAHQEARLVGQIVDGSIERRGDDIVGQIVRLDPRGDAEVNRLQERIANGELPGTSIDGDSAELKLLVDVEAEDEFFESMFMGPDGDDVNEDGLVELEMPPPPLEVYTATRIIGATAVPFPAIQETAADRQTAITAAITTGELVGIFAVPRPGSRSALVAAITPPDHPPADWFTDPGLSGPTPVRVSDDGHVTGHLALWGECHIGIAGECVLAPHSAQAYAPFLRGEVITAEGTRVRVGQITTGAGHADRSAGSQVAAQHYDNTGWAAADITVGEDSHGIWLAGALRTGLEPARLREFMAADVSGDWRALGGNLELMGIASVNVPGFPKVETMAASGQVRTLIIAASAFCPPEHPADVRPLTETDPVRARIAASLPPSPAVRRDIAVDAIARRIGRDDASRRRAAVAAVTDAKARHRDRVTARVDALR